MNASPLIRLFFNNADEPDPENRFDLSRKARSKRLHEISQVLRKHHFLKGFAPEEFRALLEDLGPSFVKIGQSLSTRSEILPRAYRDELSKLQMDSDPLPFEVILKTVEEIYGKPVSEVFEYLDSTPLGSASLAQVHKARLLNGDLVAVKIQRPGVKATMAQDIDIMRMLARRSTWVSRNEQLLDLKDVVEEFWKTFLEETDFACEAENLQLFAQLNEKVAFVTCPRVYPEYCSERILVMEYIEGIPIADKARLLECGYDLGEVGRKLLDNYAKQVLDDGFFHADPHPGNIIIRDGKIVYIDLGNTGRLSARDRAALGSIMHSVGTRNASELKDALLSFAVAHDTEAIDHARFLADLDLIVETYGSCDVQELDVGMFLNDIIQLTRKCKVTLPTSVTNIARALVTLEGTVVDYIPDDSIISIINTHIRNSANLVDTAEDALKEAALALVQASKGLGDAARYSGDVLKMLTHGQVKLNMDVLGSDAPMSTLSKIVNRLTLGIIATGLYIGSSFLVFITSQTEGSVAAALPIVGFVSAFSISLWIVVDIIRRK